jgi:hypothetical protein
VDYGSLTLGDNSLSILTAGASRVMDRQAHYPGGKLCGQLNVCVGPARGGEQGDQLIQCGNQRPVKFASRSGVCLQLVDELRGQLLSAGDPLRLRLQRIFVLRTGIGAGPHRRGSLFLLDGAAR